MDAGPGRRRSTTPEQLIFVGDEATGPGFDQLMWVMSSSDSDMAASYRVFNADGSEVEQCGNGVRCVAWMLAQADGAPSTIMLDSPAGPIEVRKITATQFSANMGAPEFQPERIPFVAAAPAIHYTLDVAGRNFDVAVISMGNPHCVIQVENTGTADVEGIGALIEHHERFPEGCNVGFVAVCVLTGIRALLLRLCSTVRPVRSK